jgi:predicted kinase
MALIVVVGIQGAGKSTMANHIVENGYESRLPGFPSIKKGNAMHVDIDNPKYMKEGNFDSKSYSLAIGFGLASGQDVIITATLIGIRGNLNLLKDLGFTNFDIKVIYLPCTLEQAKQNREEREANGGHVIPVEYNERIEGISKMLPSFEKHIKTVGEEMGKEVPFFQAEFKRGEKPIIKAFDQKLLQQAQQEKHI